MRLSRQEFLTQPFVLTSDDLNKLYVNLQKWLDKIDFKIDCKDSLQRQYSTLEDLLKFENSPQKDVRSLRIWGYTQKSDTSTLIKFDAGSFINIFVSIEGEEDAVIAISNSFDECLSGIKPWYNLLSRINFYVASYIVYLVPVAILGLGLSTGVIKTKLDPSSGMGRVFLFYMNGFLAICLPSIVGYFLSKIKRNVFPMGSFAIGQGIKRHNDKEIIRTVVIIGFFISLITGFIVSFIFTI